MKKINNSHIKKVILILLSFFSILFFSISVQCNSLNDWMPNKDFQNLVFENMKNQNININSVNDITKAKMNQLRYIRNTFRDKNKKIFHDDLLVSDNNSETKNYSIDGIQYANNLRELQLSSNLNYGEGAYVGDITNINPIKHLNKLEYLSLFGNRISDINPIINLQNNGSLKYLDVVNNSISDFSKLDLSKYSLEDIPNKTDKILPNAIIHDTNPAYYNQNIVSKPVKVDVNNPNYQFILNQHIKLPKSVIPSLISPQNYFLLKQNNLHDKKIRPYVNGANNVQKIDGERYGINFIGLKDQEINPMDTMKVKRFNNIKIPYKNYLIVRGGISEDSLIALPYVFVNHNVTPDDNSKQKNEIINNGNIVENSKVKFKKFAVYALKHVYMYKNNNFKKNERIANYYNKPRIKRPMFIVYKKSVSKNQNVRYFVKDVNHKSSTYGKKGYLTHKNNYVRPVYYQGKHKKFTVINPSGINSYKKNNLTRKVKNYKQGTVLRVKGMTKYHLTTRYILTNGRYITGNRKLIIMGDRKQVNKIRTKRAINLYKDKDLKKKIKIIKKNKNIKVKGFNYSQDNNFKVKGTKRYKINGGFITANKKLIKVIK